MRYRTKPVEREAVQYTGDNHAELETFGVPFHPPYQTGYSCVIWVEANDTWLPIEVGEWVIKDSHGYYPCNDDVFREKYEAVK